MWHYVYRTDRHRTGEYYFGIRSCDVVPTEDRYMGSGKALKAKLNADPESFTKTVLVIVQSREEACRIEAHLVGQKQVDDPLCLNLALGGDRGSYGARWTLSPNKIGPLGIPKTKEHRANLSASLRGKMTPEHKAKIVAANKRRRKHPRGE